MKLRPYQEKAMALVGERLRAGDKKVLIFMATGSGKSKIFQEMIRRLVQGGNSVLFIVRRRELIFQAAEKHFKSIGLKPSILMGNEKGFNRDSNLQVCSIDTLTRRIDNIDYAFIKKLNYVFLDEAHDCMSASYQKVLTQLNFKGCIGLTASPFPIGKRVHNFWNSCVKPIEIDELTRLGFLTKSRIYAPTKIDVSQIKKLGNDFHQGQLFDKMSELSVIGDIVNTYKKYGEDKTAILFAVNIKHSMMMAEAFKRAGLPAIHCDQSSSSEFRQKAITKLEKKEIRILCNVNIFSTGCDIKGLEVGIMARPTMSEILYIQQIGRVLRPYKICGKCKGDYVGEPLCPFCGSNQIFYKKDYAIVLDHGNNVDRHGLPNKERDAALSIKKKKTKKQLGGQEVHIKQCPECFMYSPRTEKVCGGCGYEYKTLNRVIKEENGELVLLDEEMYHKKIGEKIEFRWSQHQNNMRYKLGMDRDYPYKAIFKDFGVDVFNYIKFPDYLANELRKKTMLENASKVFK